MTNARALATLRQMRVRMVTALNNPPPGQCREKLRAVHNELQAVDVAIVQMTLIEEQERNYARQQAALKSAIV